ncbi:hypothetical protein [Paenibacillus sp. IHBB 10380]|uniref:hypothetical protein n=1 Tax=Paenibacillus sp. IHBB 10380 TaxID=1566358 RepID=UPI0005CF9743|nr:hypothetical protein [Paenibacillus sp. IHBB 10380]AJS60973.1 hypothetical protein UB51_23800 [Paenibacillus sp. IHBB 10380]
MKPIHSLLRLFMFISMVLVMAFSVPVSSHAEYTSETTPEEISSGSTMPAAAVRKPSPVLLKLKMLTRLLPILFMVYFVALLCLPNRHTPLKSSIRVLLRRLFLNPIQFTSTFVS